VREIRVPFDPLNPGQFFACCGLFDLAAHHDPEACAWFEGDELLPRRALFVISGRALPELKVILTALREAGVERLEHAEESIRPIALHIAGRRLELDWWLDEFRQETTNLKCWAGQVTTTKLFQELLPLLSEDVDEKTLMTAAAMTKSKFGIDPRSAWNALDFGYSPNEHNKDAATYPAVEILGAIGLQAFRPQAEQRDRVYYNLWEIPLPLAVARLAGTEGWKGLPLRRYSYSILKRGQSYKYFSPAEYVKRKSYYQ